MMEIYLELLFFICTHIMPVIAGEMSSKFMPGINTSPITTTAAMNTGMKDNHYYNITSCKTSREGVSYTGSVSHTVMGDVCQPWDSQIPHKHTVGISDDEFR